MPFTVIPPSTEMTCPVMYEAAGRQRNGTIADTSSGSPTSPSGVRLMVQNSISRAITCREFPKLIHSRCNKIKIYITIITEMKDDVGGEHDKMEGVGRGSWLHRQGPGVRFAGIIDDTAEALRRGWGISMLIQSWERIPRYLPAKFAHHPHNSITK
ncbi:hypothetical protein V6N12_025854 [Hibiscus sabdariffa]|uniref:Uncharacterized protein n=1 Tax=Hibiscus sabdariffa TaxID=183260 RepID=A0ABR2DQ80_9ROSI